MLSTSSAAAFFPTGVFYRRSQLGVARRRWRLFVLLFWLSHVFVDLLAFCLVLYIIFFFFFCNTSLSFWALL